MNTLIPVKYLDLASAVLKSYFDDVLNKKEEQLISFGCDVARLGIDSTVIGARWRNKNGLQRYEQLGEYTKQRTDETN